MGKYDARGLQIPTFDEFRRMARDETLSRHEKIGFPNDYREGRAGDIFSDIVSKLGRLDGFENDVLDIGPGCGELAHTLIEHCRSHRHRLTLVDSAEMLAGLPDDSFITKVPAYYPDDCRQQLVEWAGRFDAILTYSVFQIVFLEGNVFDFVDTSLGLLSDGGELLIGDIPNFAKRKRFFASPSGIRHHQEFTRGTDVPEVAFNTLDSGRIDDAVIASVLLRCRSSGYDAYWLPQRSDLPMANRREDILIRKP